MTPAPDKAAPIPADVLALADDVVTKLCNLHQYAGRPAWVEPIARAIMQDRADRASQEGRIREDERLRFEGDLDRWMKALGAGTTGYQPEAYAVMDAACAELADKRLTRETELLRLVFLVMGVRDYQYGFVDANVRGAINACLDEHPNENVVSVAARDVVAERRRQVDAEGWTAEHDDAHEDEELAAAAGCYAWPSWTQQGGGDLLDAPDRWPWDDSAWRPTNRRQMLVKAGALILAEIERLDRARLRGAAS